MSKILHGSGDDRDPNSGSSPRAWLRSEEKEQKTRRLKVIKAEEARFRGMGDSITDSGDCDGEPRVKPIKNANIVEGLEIFCRCGEKLIIRFDLEENEEHN